MKENPNALVDAVIAHKVHRPTFRAMTDELVRKPPKGFAGDLVVDFLFMLEYQEEGQVFAWAVYDCGTRICRWDSGWERHKEMFDRNSTGIRWFKVTLGSDVLEPLD